MKLTKISWVPKSESKEAYRATKPWAEYDWNQRVGLALLNMWAGADEWDRRTKSVVFDMDDVIRRFEKLFQDSENEDPETFFYNVRWSKDQNFTVKLREITRTLAKEQGSGITFWRRGRRGCPERYRLETSVGTMLWLRKLVETQTEKPVVARRRGRVAGTKNRTKVYRVMLGSAYDDSLVEVKNDSQIRALFAEKNLWRARLYAQNLETGNNAWAGTITENGSKWNCNFAWNDRDSRCGNLNGAIKKIEYGV